MTLLAKRYASALFTLAKDKGAVDAVATDLAQSVATGRADSAQVNSGVAMARAN